jgi:hypothetical protein
MAMFCEQQSSRSNCSFPPRRAPAAANSRTPCLYAPRLHGGSCDLSCSGDARWCENGHHHLGVWRLPKAWMSSLAVQTAARSPEGLISSCPRASTLMVRAQRMDLEIVSGAAIQDLSRRLRARAHRQTVQTTKLYLPAQIAEGLAPSSRIRARAGVFQARCGSRINRGRATPVD